jgi:hypothetical protein
MNVERAAGVVLIVAPLWFNANFALLGKRFDYPDILRRPTDEILERFRAGGSSLILVWWTFMLSGLLLIAGAVLLGQVLGFGGIVPVATSIGVLAGLVQMLDFRCRWSGRTDRRVSAGQLGGEDRDGAGRACERVDSLVQALASPARQRDAPGLQRVPSGASRPRRGHAPAVIR